MAYLDRISFAPILPQVAEMMADKLKIPGLNAQSPTRMGSSAKSILEEAREKVASLISAESRDVVMVSNGTESINLALRGLAHSAIRSRNRRKIVVSAIEHISVLNTARALEKEGFEIVVVPVDSYGKVIPESFRQALDEDVLMASVQMANPEIGTVQDIVELARYAKEKGAIFHTDAVDAAGWIPIDVNILNVDALSFTGTQFGGPPGAGALYLRKGQSIISLFSGGLQERHRRPGLENIPAIAGFGMAAEYARETLSERSVSAQVLANQLKEGLLSIDSVSLTGHPHDRIPGHISILVRGVEGEALLLLLDMKNIQASSGSSCTAKDLRFLRALISLGVDHADAQGSLVFSTCNETAEEDIQYVIREMPSIVKRLREMSPLWQKQ